MRKQGDALKVCPIQDACLLVMAQRPARLLGLPETRSLIFLIKNSPEPDACLLVMAQRLARLLLAYRKPDHSIFLIKNSPDQAKGYLDYLQPIIVLLGNKCLNISNILLLI
jgi:hypothetical protein